MRPSDLLGLQADLLHRVRDNDRFREVLVESLLAPYDLSKADPPSWFQEDSADAIASWVQYGMAIEVTDHMTDLIEWVAAEMQGTDQVELALAPSPYGFAHFDKPLSVRDVHGETLHLDWFVWGPVPMEAHRGIGVIGFNDVTRPDSQAEHYIAEMSKQAPEFMQVMGRWVYTSFHVLVDQERVGPPFSNRYAEEDMKDPEFGGDLAESTNVVRLVYALWTVMNQPIADLSNEHLSRATRRRMTRMRIPPQVTVIRLRRPESHRHEGESGVEWQHHWVVRGHPRWQAYGPRRSERRLIWINPHMKGNLDAPLKQSSKVYRVER